MAHPEIPHGADPDRLHAGRGDRPRRGPLRRRALRRRVRLHARRRRNCGELEFESFSADADARHVHRLQHASRLRARDGWSTRSRRRRASSIGCRSDRLSPETTDGLRRLRASRTRWRRRSIARRVRVLLRDFVTTAALREQQAAGGAPRAARSRRRPARGSSSRSTSSTATCGRSSTVIPTSSSARATAIRRRRADADREADSRRHRRLAAVVHGAADAEPLRRRAQLPLAPRVDVAPGPRSARSGRSSNWPGSGPNGLDRT